MAVFFNFKKECKKLKGQGKMVLSSISKRIKNLNTYEKNFKEAYELSKLKIRAYKIYKYLNDNLKKEDIKIKIQKIEKLLTEENAQNIK